MSFKLVILSYNLPVNGRLLVQSLTRMTVFHSVIFTSTIVFTKIQTTLLSLSKIVVQIASMMTWNCRK